MGDLSTRAAALEEQLGFRPEFAIRKPLTVSDRLCEIDVWVHHRDLTRFAALLASLGFRSFRGARSGNHSFFLEHSEDGWVKVDAKVLDPSQLSRMADLIWLARRRRGLVVAVLGADGAGKSTLIRGLADSLPFATRVVYLGWRRRRSPRAGSAAASLVEPSSSLARRLLGLVRWSIGTGWNLGRVTLRARRGDVVLCDRHPIEAGMDTSRDPGWIRGAKRMIARALPGPDLVLLLEAPAEVLLARKQEHDAEILHLMNAALGDIAGRLGGIRIDASRTPQDVLAEAEGLIWERLAARR